MIGPGKVPPASTAWRVKPSKLTAALMTARSVTGPITALCAKVVINEPRAAMQSESVRKAILVCMYVARTSLSLSLTTTMIPPDLLYQPSWGAEGQTIPPLVHDTTYFSTAGMASDTVTTTVRGVGWSRHPKWHGAGVAPDHGQADLLVAEQHVNLLKQVKWGINVSEANARGRSRDCWCRRGVAPTDATRCD